MLEALNRRKGFIVSCTLLFLITAAALQASIIISFHVRDMIKDKIRQAAMMVEETQVHMANGSMDIVQFNNATAQCADAVISTDSQSTAQPMTAIRRKKAARLRTVSTILLPSVCANEDCRSAYVGHFQMEDVFPVPAIRHVLWRSEMVSMYFAEQLRSWQRIHPDWTYVFWRDQDMEPFVATFFPGLLEKFKSLPANIMRVDMIRYMLMFKYGGVYADLDYSLARSLDTHRRFHAVVTREPDAHSLQLQGFSWPVKTFASPAFLMSTPGHVFFFYSIQQLLNARANADNVMRFAGPSGLTNMLETYMSLYPITTDPMAAIYVPPSHSFYPYPDNRLRSSNSDATELRFVALREKCKNMMTSDDLKMQQLRAVSKLVQYCMDVNNLDPITDKTQPVIAIHDLKKVGGIWYDNAGHSIYTKNLTHVRSVLKNVTFGSDFMRV